MSGRKQTPRGQTSRGGNSGPAVMLMPPHIRATFMPNPPLEHFPPVTYRRKHPITGVSSYLEHFEKTPPPPKEIKPTPKMLKEEARKKKQQEHMKALEPLIEEYRKLQKESGGEFEGINCYNTLFVGRLAYEVNERKLLRDMESFGPVKYIKIIKDKEEKSRGYAFVEYENEEDMKRAYRAADGMRIEGRHILVDVERGHTVPSFLPRRLGGGLGGTRLGSKYMNVTRPGRFDPSKPDAGPPMAAMGRGGPPPPPPGYQARHESPQPPYGMGRGGGDRYRGPPPPRGGGGGYGSGGDYDRKRRRSPSPGRRYGGGRDQRRRY
mmetsp:Transcript_244/g.460  ORF Transcript_244/g.460 Transcript_244/m.460 type:complete len:322 (-) Transcript_244:35-1000(-)|eukprot:scaffold3337_cov169-Amphora_coffeaeformis.AAC.39